MSTRELDYSAIHPNIIYAIENIPLPNSYEPYTLQGYEGNKKLRDLVKKILLRIINAENYASVLFSVKRDFANLEQDIPSSIGSFKKLFKEIEKKQHAIKDKYFYSGKGRYLQYLDSKLAESVILQFIRDFKTPILPMHDSFIVREGYQNDLKKLMRYKFKKMFKQEIKVDMKISAPLAEQKQIIYKAQRAGREITPDDFKISDKDMMKMLKGLNEHSTYLGFESDCFKR